MAIQVIWENNAEHSATAYVHTDAILSEGGISIYHKDKNETEVRGVDLLRALLKIRGVQDVRIDRYKIRIERTRVISWEKICPEVDMTLEKYEATYITQ